MKKSYIYVLLLVLALILAACGGDDEEDDGDSAASNPFEGVELTETYDGDYDFRYPAGWYVHEGESNIYLVNDEALYSQMQAGEDVSALGEDDVILVLEAPEPGAFDELLPEIESLISGVDRFESSAFQTETANEKQVAYTTLQFNNGEDYFSSQSYMILAEVEGGVVLALAYGSEDDLAQARALIFNITTSISQ